jgi:hypothetical protein
MKRNTLLVLVLSSGFLPVFSQWTDGYNPDADGTLNLRACLYNFRCRFSKAEPTATFLPSHIDPTDFYYSDSSELTLNNRKVYSYDTNGNQVFTLSLNSTGIFKK